MVVYGHTPVPQADWLNRTINIDTGCVFGGNLTALRYPEKELVSVSARATYAQPAKPLVQASETASPLTSQHVHDDLLDIDDVIGKRIVTTRLHHNVTVREENALAALEVMSRFAANPKWLIYLPPTMSPTETGSLPGLLEHPAEAFSYFRREGIARVVCEEKHMGSRAVVIVCRDEETATRRFGVLGEGFGICYTRTGRRFFDDAKIEQEFLEKVRGAVDAAGFWEQFHTDWICLDAELMPWSAKAQELLRQRYAVVGAAAKASLSEVVSALEHLVPNNADALPLLEFNRQRLEAANRYIDSYRHYCWPVQSVRDLKLAPFHLLATEGQVHIQQDHVWHMEKLAEICKVGDSLLLATPYKAVDITDTQSVQEATLWWEEMTGRGGEGMVVKPQDFIVRGRRGLTQPAVKCRGPEYLRIIYGPEYLLPENLERLRSRSVSIKRSLALREFALGIEALERFVRQEPLRRVHECVFGVLGLESEPVDPRL
jgi:protein phosphatase